jgi:glutamate-1-semialdehyde 2,1-aminomutase
MVLRVDWNDVDALRRTFERDGDDIAAVLFTPFHHPIGARAEMPSPEWWPAVESICREGGALVIVDDVRAGFRLDLAGSHHHFGFSPDLICLSKALANTHPLSAVLGVERCREAAEQVFAAGTFWSASSPMAAALANLDILSAQGTFVGMQQRARAMCDGLIERAAAVGLTLEVTGPATMPTLTFADDTESALMNAFAETMVANGVFVHPSHNLFFSAAHTDADVQETLAKATAVLDEIAHVSAA